MEIMENIKARTAPITTIPVWSVAVTTVSGGDWPGNSVGVEFVPLRGGAPPSPAMV